MGKFAGDELKLSWLSQWKMGSLTFSRLLRPVKMNNND